jgi:two-component system sensor histidine kinase BaeS
LGNVYSVYHDWGNAIQAQILQIEGDAAPDDYDRLSWWLRRQYDIALQQRMFKEQTLLSLSPELSHNIEFQNPNFG